MTFWSILMNLSSIIALVKTLIGLVEGVAKTKTIPNLQDFLPALDALEKILLSKAIDIKGVDEEEVAHAIHVIREQLSKPPQ